MWVEALGTRLKFHYAQVTEWLLLVHVTVRTGRKTAAQRTTARRTGQRKVTFAKHLSSEDEEDEEQ